MPTTTYSRTSRAISGKEPHNNINMSTYKQEYYAVNKVGFTKDIFTKRLEEQKNRCAICGNEFDEKITMKKKSADLSHLSNIPRGILCRQCNLLLGNAKDSVEILASAINYLNMWKRTA